MFIDAATLFLKVNGKEIWIEIISANRVGYGTSSYQLSILEIEPMVQEIQAGAILDSLNKNGSYRTLY